MPLESNFSEKQKRASIKGSDGDINLGKGRSEHSMGQSYIYHGRGV